MYKMLVAWIHEKERLEEREQEQKQTTDQAESHNNRDTSEFKGDKYSKGDSHEKLSGLANELRESEERLPFKDYQKLRERIARLR
jgi:hypothetical protein